MERFKKRVVWITGASSGIGEALALGFAREGARLILSSRREAVLAEVAARCGDTARLLPLDLGEPDSLPAKVEEARSIHGWIDIMVHNGGVAHRDLVSATGMSVDRRIMEVNYFGAVAITKLLLPAMLERSDGHFVVIGSLSAKYGVPRLSAYAASKHALLGFFDSLRAEVAGEGVRVTTVIPGIIRTPITIHALDGRGEPHGRMDPLHERGMSPERCAARILDAVHRKREEVVIGGPETFTVPLHRLFPGLFRRAIRNHPVRRLRRLLGRSSRGSKEETK